VIFHNTDGLYRGTLLERWIVYIDSVETQKHGPDGGPLPASNLFLLRIWCEDLGEGQFEWRGRVQHILSGESRFFRRWEELETFLRTFDNPADLFK